MNEGNLDNSQFFTDHANPKLTFMVGVVAGITIMTLAGLTLLLYVASGGDLGNYEVEQFTPSNSVLEEPVGDIMLDEDVTIQVDDSTFVYGSTDADAVTLVEYVDYECLFCKKFFPEVKQLVDDDPSLRLVIKHLPLVKIHPHAKSAALAAECAEDQGKFMEYSLQLFERQAELGDDLYMTLADELELDAEQFAACVAHETTLRRIETDVIEARTIGVKSQPNLIIWYGDHEQLIDGYVGRGYLDSVLSDL